MKNECTIIRDILPLYVDKMVSEDTIAFVEEHLEKCAACRTKLENMKAPNALEMVASETRETDTKVLKGISKKIRRGRKKALIAGISIALATVLLLFIGVSAWWYCHEYNYYSAFVEETSNAFDNENQNNGSLKPTNMYVWHDDTYQYDVVVPDFLSTGGFVGMSRLDNSETQTVELAITRWENEKYIFHIFVNDADNIRYFIIDRDLNLYGNYSEEEMKTKQEELNECKEAIQEIVNAAVTTWSFIE